eukprot:TRINITY_DN2199_c0_g1_i1.p1 TRINITY_DN2199_c0_g1~~TRINITY_DN2199_c0_g1_i1.p1  ORF type:complete len:613 (+),score=204.20 TRINITY_DN2199_c0_g1_i1:110-1840(+)
MSRDLQEPQMALDLCVANPVLAFALIVVVVTCVRIASRYLRDNERLREWVLAERVRRVPYLNYYDLVLQYQDFLDLSDPPVDGAHASPGWRVSVRNDVAWKGVAATVVGDFNRGKTWLLGQLAGMQGMLPCGNLQNTPALCAKSVKIHKQDVLILDTAGRNTPVRPVTEEGLKKKKAEECFMRDLAFDLADVVIYVVNQVTSKEQVELHQLSEDLDRAMREGTKKQKCIIIVHNLQHIYREVERREAEERLKQTYDIHDEPQEDSKQGYLFWQQYEDVKYVDGWDSLHTQTMHFLLFNDTVFKRSNRSTMRAMKHKLLGVAGAARKIDFVPTLKTKVQELLVPYFRCQNNHQLVLESQRIGPCWPGVEEGKGVPIGDIWRWTASAKRSHAAPDTPAGSTIDGEGGAAAAACGGARVEQEPLTNDVQESQNACDEDDDDSHSSAEGAPLQLKPVELGVFRVRGSADSQYDLCETDTQVAINVDLPGVVEEPVVSVDRITPRPDQRYYVVTVRANVPEPKMRRQMRRRGEDTWNPTNSRKAYGDITIKCRFDGDFKDFRNPTRSFRNGVLELVWDKQL